MSYSPLSKGCAVANGLLGLKKPLTGKEVMWIGSGGRFASICEEGCRFVGKPSRVNARRKIWSGIGYSWLSAGDDRPDFNGILVGEHLVFGDQFVAANDQVRFDQEIQLTQDVLRFLGPFDVHCSRRMAELHTHGPMICRRWSGEQGGA